MPQAFVVRSFFFDYFYFCHRHLCPVSFFCSLFCRSHSCQISDRLPCGQTYQFRFEANPIWYSAIKFTNRTERSARCTNEEQHQQMSARWNYTILTHIHLTAGRFRWNSRRDMVWVEFRHELLQFAAWLVFCRPHAYT